METLLEGSIPFILYLQGLGEGFASVMKIFTFMGNENFYLFLFPILYWWHDEKLGFRAGLILLLSGTINTYFKWIFHLPRPYWVNTDVTAGAPETSFGAPSGHAQNAVAVWGLVADGLRKPWAWPVAFLLIFMIGFSRLVLGVHFLLDVLLGWLIGAILLWSFLRLEKPIGKWMHDKSLSIKILFAFCVSLGLILLGVLIQSAFQTWELPILWVENSTLAAPDEPINPMSLSGVITNAATIFGLSTGYILMNLMGGFKPKGKAVHQVLKYIIGMIGVLTFWMGLKYVFPEGETVVAYIFRYFRYGLVGLWISFGAPWIFVKTKLAEPAKK